MPPFRFFVIAGTTLLLTTPAPAGTVEQGNPARGALAGMAPVLAGTIGQENAVRVHTLFNFFVSAPSGDSDEVRKARDDARRSIYEMARWECDLLREVLAKDCHLESVTTTIGRQFGPYQPEGLTVNGSVSMQITPK